MKKLIILLLCPLFIFSQDLCGDRPLKPLKANHQTNKEYKNSQQYLSYKKELKEWKHCIGPLGISERIDQNLETKPLQGNNQLINPCGDKPDRPKRKTNQSVDEYRKTKEHILYRQKLKEWKKCMSPINNLNTDETENQKIDHEESQTKINPCGDKPQKPPRAEGLNHEEYRQTSAHIAYREILKEWRACIKKNK